MKDENKTKVELLKELEILREEREKRAFKDITERKRAEKELKDSEEYLKILFDYAPDAYYISDLKGKFIDGNKAAERLMGYKKEELIGKSFLKLKLLSLADISKAAKALAKNIMGQPTGPDEFVLNRKDNSKVIVEISTYPVKIKERTLVLGIARDITERKRAEEETRQKTEDLILINALNDAVNRGDSLLVLFQLLARETKRIFSCHGATAYLLSGDREYLVMQILTLTPAIISRVEKLIEMRIPVISIPLKTGSLYRKALQEGKPQLINDPKTIQGLMAELTENKIMKKLVPKIYSILDTRSVINVPLVSKGEAIGLLDVSRKEPFTEFDLKRFETISGQFTSIIERKQAEQKLKKTMDATIETVSKIIEVKDPYTAGHQQRVSQLAIAIAKELNLSQDKVEGIRIASLIHDIGKIGLPTEILSKPTKLTDTEFNLIKEHSQKGYDILKSIDFAYPVDQIVLQHHEKINCTGYPNKIKGDKILLEAKIIGVADVVEAMSSHRPYRPALGIDRALEEILKNKGILYDPGVVDACLKLFKEKGFKL